MAGQPGTVTQQPTRVVAETAAEGLRGFVHRYAYGTIMLGSLMVLWWGYQSRYSIELVGNALYVAMIFLILGLELYIPYKRHWGDVRNVTRADVIYFLLAAPIDKINVLLFINLLAATQAYHHYITAFDVWPNHWPILLQLLLVITIVDFFKYWYHRWTHEVPWLWRIHSVHHSLDRLQMLRASYFYPIDIFLTVGIGTLCLLAFGVNYELIVFHNVWAGITGLMNHSNADLRCGIFDVFLNSPGHHRAHHSVGRPGCFSNYGSFFNFTDRIFGTRYLPDDQRSPLAFEPLGLDETYDYPDTVLQHLAVPFRWSKVHRAPEASTDG